MRKMNEELPRNLVLRLNAWEAGVLMGYIMQGEDETKVALRAVFEQLVDMKRQLEREAGVKKELLPNGLLRVTDARGNTIIRAPYDWEKEELVK